MSTREYHGRTDGLRIRSVELRTTIIIIIIIVIIDGRAVGRPVKGSRRVVTASLSHGGRLALPACDDGGINTAFEAFDRSVVVFCVLFLFPCLPVLGTHSGAPDAGSTDLTYMSARSPASLT